MARAGSDEDVYKSCYEVMMPIPIPSPEEDDAKLAAPSPIEEQRTPPTPALRRGLDHEATGRAPLRSSPVSTMVSGEEVPSLYQEPESTYEVSMYLAEGQYDTPRHQPPVPSPRSQDVAASVYQNVQTPKSPRVLPFRARANVMALPEQPALPVRGRVALRPRGRRQEKRVSPLPVQDDENKGEMNKEVTETLASKASYQPMIRDIKEENPTPMFPNFKKTGSIDFDARIYRCNESPLENSGKQTLVAAEENFACAIVNHEGGYLKLRRAQATLFIPPHAILGDPEPVVLYVMSKTSQVGYQPLSSSLDPGQFLVSPIMFVGKPGSKYCSMDIVLSFPMEWSPTQEVTFDLLTVKTFDSQGTCPPKDNARWRILAHGYDYFFTVYGERGVLMVSQSAFYVVRATVAGSVATNQMTLCPETKRISGERLRIILTGKTFSDIRRAKLHVVFSRDDDNETERVIQAEDQEGYRKLDLVRTISIQPLSGQPVWVSLSHLTNPAWRLQTSPTAKFSTQELLDYADRYPPSVTFALGEIGNEYVMDSFVQCVVVAHQGAMPNHQAEDVVSYVQLVGDVTIMQRKSGQFLSMSLGRASGKKLPVLSVQPSPCSTLVSAQSKPNMTTPIIQLPSHLPLIAGPESPRVSNTSSCPSHSPPPVPSSQDHNAMTWSTSYSYDDAVKCNARFDGILIPYQFMGKMCLYLQDARAEARGRGWKSVALKIGLSEEQLQNLTKRYAFQSPLAMLHLFFGASQTIWGVSAHDTARGHLARLLSISQDIQRDDLLRELQRELTNIDRLEDRQSMFLFDALPFESKTGKGALSGSNRHSLSDTDVKSVTSEKRSTGTIRSHLSDMFSWFRSKSHNVAGKKAEDVYLEPVAVSNFRIFDDAYMYDVPKATGCEEMKREKKTKKLNQYM
ncbi:uncharacterized protein [Diadema setosum]|uniref:uncharacterized protein n=1 Tax=Diadema setosum TaxID=31175 RepID=UPI003B3B157E